MIEEAQADRTRCPTKSDRHIGIRLAGSQAAAGVVVGNRQARAADREDRRQHVADGDQAAVSAASVSGATRSRLPALSHATTTTRSCRRPCRYGATTAATSAEPAIRRRPSATAARLASSQATGTGAHRRPERHGVCRPAPSGRPAAAPGLQPAGGDPAVRDLALRTRRRRPRRDRGLPARRRRGRQGSYLSISYIGTDFFADKAALGRAVAVYEQASERVWPRPQTQILGFFDGFDLLEPGLVPKHEWWPVVGKAANGTPNIQWGGVARKA